MSMNTCPLNEIGFILDIEAAMHINLRLGVYDDSAQDKASVELMLANPDFSKDIGRVIADEGWLEDDPNLAWEALQSEGVDAVAWYSDFEGIVETTFPDKTDNPMEETYENEALYMIRIAREPSLFHAAYSSPDELVEEYKDLLGKYLPEDFDWWRHIVTAYGTYYC